MKVYCVIFDGWPDSYGTYIYCGGMYSDLKRAETRAREITPLGCSVSIVEFDVDKSIDVKEVKSAYDETITIESDLCLGGYAE